MHMAGVCQRNVIILQQVRANLYDSPFRPSSPLKSRIHHDFNDAVQRQLMGPAIRAARLTRNMTRCRLLTTFFQHLWKIH